MSSITPINASTVVVRNATNASAAAFRRTPDVMIKGSDGLQHGVYVDSGPVWLVRLLYHPPGYLVPTAVFLGLLVVVIALYKVLVHDGVKPEALRESANRALFLSAVVGSVLLLRSLHILPYLVTVFGGAIAGIVVARVIRSSSTWDDLLDQLMEGPLDAR